jgi:PAS domain S-box-containing protein
MKSDRKTKNELIEELESVRNKVKKLETLLKKRKPTEQNITEHKREAEEASRMVTVVRDSNDAITIQDFEGKITAWNRGAELMYGYSEQEAKQKNIWQLTPSNKAAEQKDFTRQLIAGEKISSFETQRLTKDGRLLDVWLTATKLVDDAGEVIGIASTERDITERKRAEEALRESETRYRSVLQSATDAIVTADSSGIIIGWNSGAERIFGYSYTEAAGQPLTFLMPFYHHTRHTNGMKRVISGGDQHVIGTTVEFEGLRKDKSVFPIELSLSTWETKSGQFFTGIIRDITERKRVEEALITSELRYRRLFESAKDGILILDAETGKIIDANPFLLEILDYSREEVIGKELWEIGSFKNIIANQDTFRKLQLQEYIHYEHLLLYNKDGVTIHVEFVSNIYFMDEHKVIQCNIRDITERERIEEQMRQLQKLEGLGTLAGGIAHDFNNILGIILAYITSTKRFKDDAKKLDLAVNTIVKAVERGKTLVQQILTFARKTETEFGAVNVNDVVMEIMAMIFETFPKILTYAQNFDKSITFINADRSQLYQVLLNLCVNARDAMPSGGVLTINTRMVSVASLRNQHPDAAASGYVCIEVSDTGEGMSEEIKKRIFEPFFTTKGIGKGTGLGLSVVFGIVQAHKGYIDVESELGKGTTFRLYLPASQVAAPISVKDEETLEEIPGGTETLLVVEDEEMLMMSLRMVLVEKGYKVLSTVDGLTALKIYQERKDDIALVLTDLGLPNMNGLEVCQRIKKINPNEHVILATGFLDPEMKSEFLKAGIQNFLYKPYDLKKVLKVVRDVLDEK